MPRLGIDDSRLASVSEIPRLSSSAGIKKTTPLIKRKELAVTPSEMIMIDQRAPLLSSGCSAPSPFDHVSTPDRRS
jgi:hypothetical protein